MRGLAEKGLIAPRHVAEAALLTGYAFEARYPGLAEPVAEDEYRHALELAEAVVRWAESVIREHPA